MKQTSFIWLIVLGLVWQHGAMAGKIKKLRLIVDNNSDAYVLVREGMVSKDRFRVSPHAQTIIERHLSINNFSAAYQSKAGAWVPITCALATLSLQEQSPFWKTSVRAVFKTASSGVQCVVQEA